MTYRSNGRTKVHPETLATHAGRDPFANFGVVNPPVYHASTIVHRTLAELREADRTPYDGVRYGRRGTPTTFALEEAVATLEGGYRSIAVPSGLSAITTTLLAFLRQGDHLLMVDTVYYPTRHFCDTVLTEFGVETTYYDPRADIGPLLRPETRVVFLESPGSLTYEIQDVRAVAHAARAAAAVSVIDNTWSAGLYFNPFAHGIDISIQAATKYIVGHSDVMLGLITTTEEHFLRVKRTSALLGTSVGPDDCYLGLRGLRTLPTRLARHHANAETVAAWLQQRPEVQTVLYPPLPASPDHALWRRDFTGANGLLSVVLQPGTEDGVASMLDGMRLFAMGYSWGGFESLIIPFDPRRSRTASSWTLDGPCLRLHCGLEHTEDLVDDLDQALSRLTSAA